MLLHSVLIVLDLQVLPDLILIDSLENVGISQGSVDENHCVLYLVPLESLLSFIITLRAFNTVGMFREW
jgi:hypothetical protein